MQDTLVEADTLSAALAFAERGIPVFPCKRDKSPHTDHGFHDATTDPGRIREWWSRWPSASIGIRTGDGLVVLDFDGPAGLETMADLERELGPLPETVQVHTGGGGRHVWLRTDEDFRNAAGIRDGFDVRGAGGYVIAPPSPHPSGRTYTWETDPEVAAVAPIPPAWAAVLRRPREAAPEPAGRIREGGRNDALIRRVGTLRDKGEAEETILAMMLAWNATACDPPLPQDEVERTVRKACERWAPGEDTRVVIGKRDPDQPRRRSLFDIHAPDPDAHDELIRFRFLTAGGAIISPAQTGIGKSSFWTQAAMAWALGQDWHGFTPTRPLRSLIIQAENDDGDLTDIRDGFMHYNTTADRQALAERVAVETVDHLDGTAFLAYLAESLRDYRPDVLMLDPVMTYCPSTEPHEVQTWLSCLTGLLREHRCGAVAPGHVAKPPKDGKNAWAIDDWAYAMAGTSRWGNWARGCVVLKRKGDSDVFDLLVAKRHQKLGWTDADGNKTRSRLIRYGDHGLYWLPAGDGDVVDVTASYREAALAVLRDGMKAGEWDAAIRAQGLNRDDAAAARAALVRDGFVTETKIGPAHHYTATGGSSSPLLPASSGGQPE